MIAEPLAILGVGLVSAAGVDDDDALARLLYAGDSALARRSRIACPPPRWTGSVPDRLDASMGPLPDAIAPELCVDWGVRAGRRALARAALGAEVELGLVFATNLEDHPRRLPQLAAAIADALGIAGPRLVTSMACASALAALSLARVLLAEVDAVLVVASDVLTPRVVGGFAQLSLLCEEPCSPFSVRLGTSLGEGAAAFVVAGASADATDFEGWAEGWISGLGLAADGFHAVAPEPGGRGTRAAVAGALAEAGLDGEAIELVVAHGTGTSANDDAELRGLLASVGPSLVDTPIVGLKSVFGHAQGAGAGLELGALLLGWRRDFAVCTAGFAGSRYADDPRAAASGGAPTILTRETRASLSRVPRRALQTSAGFGGSCGALVIERDRPERDTPPSPAPAPLYLRSWASAGWGEDGLDWRRALRRVDLRGADPSTRYLSLAVARALGRWRDPGLGLVVAQPRSSPAAVARLRSEIERHGLEGASASVFCDPLIVMPAGACARELGLHGPYGVCVSEAGAASIALRWAVELLARRPSCPGIVAAVVDEHLDGDGHGAAAFVVAREGPVAIEGLALAQAGRGDRALARACARAGVEVGALDRCERVDAPSASAGARALLQCCDAITGPAAVVVDEAELASVAVILTRADSRAD